ncbi:MAG: hypothetical protein AUI33_14195 [Ignavibacteria bacterium 13_1_40CM_2_61_4]|nr:MAG: hypothetical protein AUI33_14195 [Ignavibacteria bacterium 13_1_40CM_2_61_4]
MEEIKILEDVKGLNWEYDADADVLYVSIGAPESALGMDIGGGVIIRYDEKSRRVVGLTVMGVKERIMRGLKK